MAKTHMNIHKPALSFHQCAFVWDECKYNCYGQVFIDGFNNKHNVDTSNSIFPSRYCPSQTSRGPNMSKSLNHSPASLFHQSMSWFPSVCSLYSTILVRANSGSSWSHVTPPEWSSCFCSCPLSWLSTNAFNFSMSSHCTQNTR